MQILEIEPGEVEEPPSQNSDSEKKNGSFLTHLSPEFEEVEVEIESEKNFWEGLTTKEYFAKLEVARDTTIASVNK